MTSNAAEILMGKGLGSEAIRGEVFRIQQSALPALAKFQGDADLEKEALQIATAEVAKELSQHAAGSGSAEILLALEQMLTDPELRREALEQVDAGWNAASAIQIAAQSFADLFAGDEFLAERGMDLVDLSQKVARKILKLEQATIIPTDSDLVLVATDLTPDEIATLPKNIVAVVLSGGSTTSHTAIMLRSLGVPAVIGCKNSEALKDGELVLVDPVGDRVVRGGDQQMATRAISFVTRNLDPLIPVRANIGSVQEAFVAGATAASGVGLVRTEFLYLGRPLSPSIDEQADLFEQLLRAAPDGPILIRTIDIAGDKEVPFLSLPPLSLSQSADAGYRVVSLYPEFVSAQLLAIEQARQRVGREVSVMAPMVSDVAQAREFAELARGLGDFRVGVMVETPQLAQSISELSGVVDFVSVGTNDLSQYLFNLDRYAPENAEQLSYWQPRFIRALGEIARSAKHAGIAAGVCGESAADPEYALVLAGLGFESVSVSVSSIASVRSALSSASLNQAESLALLASQAPSAAEAQSIVRSELNRLGLES